tara:strand:+ start:41 stop:2353 length:2313 start_codon:yes stop_codon:yes gene_type:complete
MKHCKNERGQLVCVDFDDMDYKSNPLYIKLYNMKVLETTSKHGAHMYIAIKNLADFSNEIKVQLPFELDGEMKEFDTDLILKGRNMWEYWDEDIFELKPGPIPSIEWDELKGYFDEKKMNFKGQNKKVTIPMKPSASDDNLREQNIIRCGEKQFVGYLKRLKPFRYQYGMLIDIGIMCFNNFDGTDKGCRIWEDWNSQDETPHDQIRDRDFITEKWNSFKKRQEGPLLDYRKLKKWADEDCPCNPYEEIFKSAGVDAMIHEMNTGEVTGVRCGLNNATSEFIIETPGGWYLKNDRQAMIHFEHYSFVVKDEDDADKSFVVKPFQTWRLHPKKNVWNKVSYDPSGQESGDYNLWKGIKLTKEDVDRFDEADAQPILDHILTVWADGDRERYEYILNWFAHKLQFPAKKMAVCLCLNSGEGAGKNVVLNFFFKIMGDNYDSIANQNQILGDFNACLEGRILLNFDEVTYGGDHSANNKLKALISEDYMYINKKNKEAYRIRSLADFIITTNEEYFIGVSGDSRRYCPFQLNGKWVGEDSDEKEAYFQLIRDCPPEAFAKILYNRDISGFNARKFKKTLLFQQQVERSWNSDIRWLYQTLESGLLKTSLMSQGVVWMEMPMKQGTQSNLHYELYGAQGVEAHNDCSTHKKENRLIFKKGDRKYYILSQLYNMYSGCRMGSYCKTVTPTVFLQTLVSMFGDKVKQGTHPQFGKVISLPELDEARQCFNKWSRWDYRWGADDSADDEDWDDITFNEERDQPAHHEELLKKNEENI